MPRFHLSQFLFKTSLCFLGLYCSSALAQNQSASSSLYGPLGLNTIPNARMDKTGTIKAGVSTLDPYMHGWLSVQIAEPLYLNLRQSAEISNINKDAKRLYPGMDVKWRLQEESANYPEIALGLQSAIGHKRMAGEYLTLSKRYNNFDFTAGLGWGRLGSAGHFKNPLSILGSHFKKERPLDGEIPAQPKDWFTGENIGLFAGIEYFTPLRGLSLKFDYGADRYAAERAAFDFAAPAPWSAGINYMPLPGIALGVAAQGADKIMGRLTLSGLLQNWRRQDSNYKSTAPIRIPHTNLSLPTETESSPTIDDKTTHHEPAIHAKLALRNKINTPRQVADAARYMTDRAGPDVEELAITPTVLSLKGPQIKLLRRDLEAVETEEYISAEEIWHNTQIEPDKKFTLRPSFDRPTGKNWNLDSFHFNLEHQTSLSEEDSGTLYRSSLIAGRHTAKFRGLIDNFYALRLNLSDNLDGINQTRLKPFLPVRSDVDLFARQKLSVDKFFSAFTHSFRSDLHLSLLGGYLEEMYGGFGGEILYRPFNGRFAVGAESWLALKRDPLVPFNLGFNGDSLISGHVNGWYDLPLWNTTAHLSIGRYLAEDIGGTIGLQKQFANGTKIEGFLTLTNSSDPDPFGAATHNYSGISLTLPLGGYKYIPRNTDITLKTAPFGRDSGQRLHNPLPLYELTEPFSAAHMAQNWGDITPEP
ncbi:MAG: YjbH domain-containing protein [Alphaproteobacteria bacterium]|nr:YjbH domain-containing protein [Alphaproteobacteria bacterium]